MTKVLVTERNLQDIASAIRSKNGSNDSYRPGDMAAAILAIPTGSVPTLVSKTITQNGSYDAEDDNSDGYSDVTVNVSNSYSAEDEGKVVSSGALVAQTGLSVTENGTYDTTENDEVVVNVSGGGSSSLLDVLAGKRFCVRHRSGQYYGGFGGVGIWPSSGTTTSGENLAPYTDNAIYTINEIKKIIFNGGVLAHCEYLGYVNSTIINDFGLVELARVTTTAQTDITLADDLSNYDAVFLQGIYQSGGETSQFDSTLIYAPVALNTEYKTGMKDRWAPGDTGVTFTSNTTAVLSDQKLVIIYGMSKQSGGNT